MTKLNDFLLFKESINYGDVPNQHLTYVMSLTAKHRANRYYAWPCIIEAIPEEQLRKRELYWDAWREKI